MINHIYREPQFGEDWFTYKNFYKFIVGHFPPDSHFVEIGCWKGKSSSFMAVEIANSRKKIKFDCIDTWLGSEEHKNYDIIKKDELYNLFLDNMKPLTEYFNPIRKTSHTASNDYENNSLDFVFIDGDHSYNGVFQDITDWFPKVKRGGIISGHDYWPGTDNWIEVFKAVNDYFLNKKEIINYGDGVWMVYV